MLAHILHSKRMNIGTRENIFVCTNQIKINVLFRRANQPNENSTKKNLSTRNRDTEKKNLHTQSKLETVPTFIFTIISVMNDEKLVNYDLSNGGLSVCLLLFFFLQRKK